MHIKRVGLDVEHIEIPPPVDEVKHTHILPLGEHSAQIRAPDHSRSLPEIIQAANGDDWRSNNRNNEIAESGEWNEEIPSRWCVIDNVGL